VEKTVDRQMELPETWRIFALANFVTILIYRVNPYSCYRSGEPNGISRALSACPSKKVRVVSFPQFVIKKI
jgi:hypothetical protein